VIAAGLLAMAAPALAAEDEYNFSWLDPDKKIYVLQNRRYLKANRFLVSATVGTGFSNPYRTVYTVDPRIAYYLSEAFGVELMYQLGRNSANGTAQALQTSSPNAPPIVREIKSTLGGLVHYVPWYAKINVFNNILYFDWYFTAGVGSLRTEVNSLAAPNTYTSDDRVAVLAGTGHQYHLSNQLTVRLDLTGAFYSAPVFGKTGSSAWFSNYVFGIGLGYRL
jgi:outer membrane beta-barrel protein